LSVASTAFNTGSHCGLQKRIRAASDYEGCIFAIYGKAMYSKAMYSDERI
jgi:hypothetical protein